MRKPDSGPGPFLIAAWHAGQDASGIGPPCDGPAGSDQAIGNPAGCARPCLCAGHFDGKIERPRLSGAALPDESIEALGAHKPAGAGLASLLSAWDFSREPSGTRIVDVGPARRHGQCINLPTRAMTGHAWSGESPDWRQAPADYGAIHFHHDDIYDCSWRYDFEFDIPDDLPSAVYAARLRTLEAEYHIPFYVRAPHGTATADVAFLAPTATYLSYANIITLNFDPLSEAIGGGAADPERERSPAPRDARTRPLDLRPSPRRQRSVLLLAPATGARHAAARENVGLHRRHADRQLARAQRARFSTSSPTRICTERERNCSRATGWW